MVIQLNKNISCLHILSTRSKSSNHTNWQIISLEWQAFKIKPISEWNGWKFKKKLSKQFIPWLGRQRIQAVKQNTIYQLQITSFEKPSLSWNPFLKPHLSTQPNLHMVTVSYSNVLFWRHCVLKQNIWDVSYESSTD